VTTGGDGAGTRARWAWALVAAGAGAAFTVLAFYPGYMSPDSVAQLGQARSGQFDAWHPPLMAWAWGLLDRWVPGPVGMLLLQNALFWSGLALAAATTLPGPRGAVAVMGVGLLPPVIALLGTIWKDVQMGAALTLATGLLIQSGRRGGTLPRMAAVAALGYAAAVRHNAWLAILPLAAWLAWQVARERGLFAPRAWAVAGGALLTLALQATVGLATRAVLDGGPTYPLQDCFVHDLVAISLASGRDELPAWEYHGTGTAPIEVQVRRYVPETVDTLVYAPRGYRHFTDGVRASDLRLHWLDAVRRHPGTWLRHRWGIFSRLLGVEDSHLIFWGGVDPNPLGVVLRPSALNHSVMAVLRALERTFLFRVWLWWAAGVVALGWAVRTGRATAGTWALVASGALYLIPFFVAAPSDDFRYAWWTVLTTLLALFSLRRRAAPGATRT
jgi:hypothetical protein